MAAGAEGLKTEFEARTQGGKANEPYDHCYHKECDNINNVNQKCFLEMTQNAANAVAYFAYN